MKRATNRFMAVTVVLSVLTGCATSGRGGLRPLPTPVASLDDYDGLKPTRVNQSDIGQQDVRSGSVSAKDTMLVIRRQLLKTLTPLATALSVLSAAPVYALQQLEPRSDDRPLVRRSSPQGRRRTALAFVRTELFFGTAKPGGVVTEEEFDTFLDDVVAPLFPDGLTVVKAKGRFRGADGATVKEDSYVLVLLYPVEDRKVNNSNIEFVRNEYMRQQRQESVLRVNEPFLVWVSL
jgi:hypothetical protein